MCQRLLIPLAQIKAGNTSETTKVTTLNGLYVIYIKLIALNVLFQTTI